MKREQILDMIGEAPHTYVDDAQRHRQPRRMRRWWLGAAAAMLAVVMLFHMPAIPMIITAKAVSSAAESRRRTYQQVPEAERQAWWAENDLRAERLDAALPSIADFTQACSEVLLSGTDSENCIWSPVNAYIALAMTAELTDGETQAELLSVLGAASVGELRPRISAVWESAYEDNGNEICILANSLWLDRDLSYAKETMDILAHDYYASVYQGDLGSSRTNRDIANWMKNQTGGFLTNRTGKVTLAPGDQMLTMASTVYFQAKWSHEFDAGMNTDGLFHAPGGDVSCTFMNRKLAHMNYYWAEDFGAVQVFMKNGSSMWFILPDEDKSVDDVLESDDYLRMLTLDDAFISDHSRYMKVNLSVPQFDVSAGMDVKAGLQSLGVTKVFDWTQNGFASSLQSKTSDYPVYLDSIHQDVRVKIDEKGVTAASYIELNFGAGAAAPPDEIIDFVLDRPFVFAVTKSGIPLFVGTVNCPQQNR